jgi:hypothetical protein
VMEDGTGVHVRRDRAVRDLRRTHR